MHEDKSEIEDLILKLAPTFLLIVSEAMPFLKNKHNGLLHLIASFFKKTERIENELKTLDEIELTYINQLIQKNFDTRSLKLKNLYQNNIKKLSLQGYDIEFIDATYIISW